MRNFYVCNNPTQTPEGYTYDRNAVIAANVLDVIEHDTMWVEEFTHITNEDGNRVGKNTVVWNSLKRNESLTN